MIVAIHQPNFAPWPGFFYKIKQSDAFVLLDNVEYQSGNATSITNRTKIKTPQGELFISVPAKKGATLIKDVLIDNAQPWRKKMLKTVQQNYTKAPFFKEFFPRFENEINKQHTHLSALNIELIKLGCAWLEIKTPIQLSSELGIDTDDKNLRIVEICKRLGGTVYLSGNGARKYNDESLFNANGIELRYTTFMQQPYPQLHGEFVPGLSVLDLVFNCGNVSLS
ncbi:MAG TPA: WbqC family protein [Chitinophagales bacterium]|nr:WbqC family protein [Chitinophagales bacterium]